jgi:TrpR-related protein YerC/YecD
MKTNRPVTLRQEQQHERALCTAILALRTVEECRSFFRDLCTPAELQAMADRWAVVELLERGLPYREIHRQTGVSVTTIGVGAFSGCTSLTGVYFTGNAPSADLPEFDGDENVILYYLPGSTGWNTTFADRPAALWNPQALTSDASFGVRTNQFGFTLSWASDRVIVVEACTDLAHPVWFPQQTKTLAGGSSYFSDPQWTNGRISPAVFTASARYNLAPVNNRAAHPALSWPPPRSRWPGFGGIHWRSRAHLDPRHIPGAFGVSHEQF